MNEIILLVSVLFMAAGVGVFVWSLINTRKRYVADFMKRKSLR
ncbi:hypothetical protein [Pseudomonas chlororaphis]